MKKITLTLTKEKWWDEIKSHTDLSPLAKAKLPAAVHNFLRFMSPPKQTPVISQADFQKLQNEIEEIFLDNKPMFLVCETKLDYLILRLTNEKSPGWDEKIFVPGKEYDEGIPIPKLNLSAPKEDRIYLIRTIDNSEHYIPYIPSVGTGICTITGSVINKKKITGWFRVC
jgi:hypothetical protein